MSAIRPIRLFALAALLATPAAYAADAEGTGSRWGTRREQEDFELSNPQVGPPEQSLDEGREETISQRLASISWQPRSGHREIHAGACD
jgi:hypothetical protein